jgi:hypothetical protein
VSVLCALALILLSLTHRPLTVEWLASDPAIAAYLGLGDSLDDLCLSGESDDQGASHEDCPACTLAKSIAPGPAFRGPTAPTAMAAERLLPTDLPLLAWHSPRAPPARRPPAFQLI